MKTWESKKDQKTRPLLEMVGPKTPGTQEEMIGLKIPETSYKYPQICAEAD